MSITISGLQEIQNTLKHIDEHLYPIVLRDVTKDAFANVKNRAKKHYDTGNMEDNISFRVRKKYGEVFIEDAGMMVAHKGKSINYASFVLYGTRPHKIVPKEKKSLRFSNINAFVFAKLIKHPGYKGDNFLYDGVQDTFKKLDKIINKVVNNEFR